MPVLRLTDRAIHRLKAERQTDYVDPTLPEFGLRVNPKKAKTWWVRVKLGDRRLRLKIGRWPTYTRDEAWEIARKWLQLADQGIDPRLRIAAARFTLGDLFDQYIAAQKKKGRRYWKSEEGWFRTFEALRSRPAASIERREVREALAAKREHGAPTAENARALLRRVYRFGIEEDLVAVDPTAGLRRVSEQRVRDRVLSDEEIRKLWALWEERGSAGDRALQLMLLLGTRHRETLLIRRANIRDGWLEIEGEHTKNGRPHVAAVTTMVRAVIDAAEAAQSRPSPWLFPNRDDATKARTGVQRPVRYAVVQTGVKFMPHDLRRTVYSALRRLGIKEEVIAAFFNHAPTGLRRNYDKWSYGPERREAAEVWHADLRRILEKREPGRVVPIHRTSPQSP